MGMTAISRQFIASQASNVLKEISLGYAGETNESLRKVMYSKSNNWPIAIVGIHVL